MVKSKGLSHVAMSVAEGTLTEEYREELLGFYGDYFRWREIEQLRLPDRFDDRGREQLLRQPAGAAGDHGGHWLRALRPARRIAG